MSHHGDDTPFGFRIPPHWPKWKLQCSATSKTTKNRCGRWAVRGMPTCRFHGSGGERNAKLGLIRYLAWVCIGLPRDTPVDYARFASMAAALEMMFNNGAGTEAQRLQAALWLTTIPDMERVGSLDIRTIA